MTLPTLDETDSGTAKARHLSKTLMGQAALKANGLELLDERGFMRLCLEPIHLSQCA